MLYRKNIKNSKISILLIISLIVGLIIIPEYKVKAADVDWVIAPGFTTTQYAEVKTDKIIITGTHHAADDDTIRYKTTGYYMTLKMYDKDSEFSSGSNSKIVKEYLNVDVSPDVVDGSTATTTYTISRDEFTDVAEALFEKTYEEFKYNGEYLDTKGSITVYLSNIFDIVKGEDDSIVDDKKGIFGYREMLAAHDGWNDKTVENLKGYYNLDFTLTDEICYKVKYKVVDTSNNPLEDAINEDGVKISDILSPLTKSVICGEDIDYSLSEKNKSLSLNGKRYAYTYWSYSYTAYGGGNQTTSPKGGDVSIDAPNAEGKSTLTVYLVYEPQTVKYLLDVVAVDTKMNPIMDFAEGTKVTAGGSYNYSGTNTKTINVKELNYSYQNHWVLVYEVGEDTAVSKTMEGNATENYAASVKPLPYAKEGSTATLKLIYDTKPITPTPTPTTSPTETVTPTPTAAPTPTPELEPVITPVPDSRTQKLTSAFTTGIIRADNRGNEKFTVTAGIPTTESLFGQVTAKEYLLGYQLTKKVGKITYSIKVSKTYILEWKNQTTGKTEKETVPPIVKYVSVERAYGYWEIESLEYYNINKAALNNYALPGGKLTLTPKSSYYSPPSISYSHSSDMDYHIIPPDEFKEGIELTQIVPGGTRKPNVPNEDFTYEALSRTGNIKVRSDSLTFGGATVISSAVKEIEAPNINISALPQCNTYTNNNALYDNDQVIKSTKLNGTYASTGEITYGAIAKVGSYNNDTLHYSISGINDIVIHTPVICDPVISADNDKYVQLLKPTRGCTELVLDPDSTLSDFTLQISNTGFHTGIAGYFTRDFSKSLHDTSASYIAEKNGLLRNEVKFPFDVFVDKGNDNNAKNDDYIKAGTWITIGRSTVRFYLPTWIEEGVYMANFRTVAVNGEDHLQNTESYANRDRMHYVATNTAKFEVSGRIYGLTLYDISDYPMWEEVFRMPDTTTLKKCSLSYQDGTKKTTYNKSYHYTYTVGTNDQYGKDTGRNVKYTVPLVNGSHPYYKNQGILKTGYMFRFSLDTIGDMFSDGTRVIIKPSFYFVDKNGKNRTAVDLYYKEEINGKSRSLVKVGGARDDTNIKSYHTGNLNLGIPTSEMKLTATLRNMKYGDYFWHNSAMFTFAKIQLNYAFRTLIGQDYAASITKLDSYDTIKATVSQSDAEKSMQRWYGQYYIPNEVHVVKKGYDVMDYADKYGVDYDEDFWLTDGYILVNFNIYTLDDAGKQHLSYVNADNYMNNGNCSMWIMEGAPLSKTSYKGPDFNFYAGDFFIYYADKRMSSDYSTGAIY